MKSDVVFAFPNFSWGRFSSYQKHLGAAYLMAHLRQRGWTCSLYHQPATQTLAQAGLEIASLSRRCVGFTCFDTNFHSIALLSRIIKQINPDLEIILGGPSATFSADLVLQAAPDVSVCFKGMAEESLIKYLEAADTDKPYVPGTATRVDGKIVHNSPMSPLSGSYAIDHYPSPYLSGVLDFRDGPSVGVLTSRGCFYGCTYCNFAAMSNRRIQFHSPDRILSELEGIRDALRGGAGSRPVVTFADDFFTIHRSRLVAICTGIIAARMAETLAFECQTRADWVDRELLEMLRDAGVVKLHFGLESASPKVLKLVKKLYPKRPNVNDYEPERQFLETFRSTVADAKRLGFNVHVSAIFGLPGEGPEEAQQTLDFVKSVEADGYSHNYLNIYPGTELFETSKQFGITVRPSATTLPFQTYYAYDVTKVPVLNLPGDLFNVRKRISQEFVRAFFPQGKWESDTAFASIRCELSHLDGNNPLWPWLRNNASPATQLLNCRASATSYGPEDLYPHLISAGTPIVNYYTLEPIENAQKSDGLQQCEEIRYGNRASGFVLRVGVQHLNIEAMIALWERLILGGETSPRIYFTEITSPADLIQIGELLRRNSRQSRLPLTNSFLAQDMQVSNICQYGIRPCPATTRGGFQLAQVNADGMVRPCSAGPIVGDLKCNLPGLRKNFLEIFRAANESRCVGCSRATTCSKCPSLDCAELRNRCDLSMVFSFLELVRMRERIALFASPGNQETFELMLTPPAFVSESAKHNGHCRRLAPEFEWPEVLTLASPNRFLLLDLNSSDVFELNHTMVEIFEALRNRIPWNDAMQYFTKTYLVPEAQVESSIDTAQTHFKKIFSQRNLSPASGR